MVRLRDEEGLSRPEIAERMGVSVQTVWRRICWLEENYPMREGIDPAWKGPRGQRLQPNTGQKGEQRKVNLEVPDGEGGISSGAEEIPVQLILDALAAGMGWHQIARNLGISRMSLINRVNARKPGETTLSGLHTIHNRGRNRGIRDGNVPELPEFGVNPTEVLESEIELENLMGRVIGYDAPRPSETPELQNKSGHTGTPESAENPSANGSAPAGDRSGRPDTKG